MSEVGFESGTFRSCVEHSNHCATEARPISVVLLVLFTPKYSVTLARMRHNITTIDVSPNPGPEMVVGAMELVHITLV